MLLALSEAQKISTELKKSHVQASVGIGLDKLYFYVYSTDPAMKCKCSQKSFNERARKVVEQRLSQYENVVVTVTGTPQAG
jgi:hypothetical protein